MIHPFKMYNSVVFEILIFNFSVVILIKALLIHFSLSYKHQILISTSMIFGERNTIKNFLQNKIMMLNAPNHQIQSLPKPKPKKPTQGEKKVTKITF